MTLLKGNRMIKQFLLVLAILLATTSCVYKLDIQQGNLIIQKDIDKLRPELSKNQVVFVMGNPVVDDSFSDDNWIYINTYSNRNKGTNTTKRLELFFTEDKLVSAQGDYEIPEGLQNN
ncbi:MAG: outer membrane protein assembly factor BamE [Polaribacter sp.]|jgi:outer membrane protein assembly factor BamE